MPVENSSGGQGLSRLETAVPFPEPALVVFCTDFDPTLTSRSRLVLPEKPPRVFPILSTPVPPQLSVVVVSCEDQSQLAVSFFCRASV